MQVEGMPAAAVINLVNEIKTQFEQQIAELNHQINKYKNEAIDFRNKYLWIKEQHELLLYKRFMRSSEQMPLDVKQHPLFTPEEEVKQPPTDEPPKENETITITYERKKPGRKPIDPSIRREVREVELSENELNCACGCILIKIGEEISEKLHYVPADVFVVETRRFKYACPCCEGADDVGKPAVRVAPVEPSMIPRSIASESLLGHIMTHKFVDHQPYFRQEKEFKRIGVRISRQDMANWQQQSYEKLTPLYEHIEEAVKKGPLIQKDETTMLVMKEEGRDNTKKSYIWLTRGGLPNEMVVIYDYFETRKAENAKKYLDGFKGFLQTDGYDGYDCAVKDFPDIIHTGCLAHIRRRFFEAAKMSEKSELAEECLNYIRKLYEIDSGLRAKELADEEFVKKRKESAMPVINEFHSFLLKLKESVLTSGLLGIAVKYSLSQWNKMIKYLEHPLLTPDTNAIENCVRPVVLSRKNFMQFGSPAGAKSACGFFTLVETAKQNGYEPGHYLTALFEKAPFASTPEDWKKLLPWNIFKD